MDKASTSQKPDVKKAAFTDMLQEIVENDRAMEEENRGSGFVSVTPIVFWTQLFAKYFLHSTCDSYDDLLFYVKKRDGHSDEVVVHRKESQTSPGLGDSIIDWHETVFLNMVLHQLDYTLWMAICSKDTPDSRLIIHKRKSMKVYPSPSHHQMARKGEGAKLTYPNIFFTIDNFEEEWSDMCLGENQKTCVELIANDKKNPSFRCVLFFGAVDHSQVKDVYHERVGRNTSDWMQKWSFGLYKAQQEPVFLRMKGPNGCGYAEMAIQSVSRDDSRGHSSARAAAAESLRTQLTYLSQPWQNIVLKLMQQFEKPKDGRTAILTRGS